jgi:hypothetical protein
MRALEKRSWAIGLLKKISPEDPGGKQQELFVRRKPTKIFCWGRNKLSPK